MSSLKNPFKEFLDLMATSSMDWCCVQFAWQAPNREDILCPISRVFQKFIMFSVARFGTPLHAIRICRIFSPFSRQKAGRALSQ
jgi:hypothetical protein